MKNKKAITITGVVIIAALLVAAIFLVNTRYHFIKFGGEQKVAAKDLYYCPMHPNIQSDKPGECPICYMSLVKKETPESPAMGHAAAEGGEKKILYYRNPMNPQVTSPAPMKDEMGMDYVPVYAEEGAQEHGGVYINPAKQQLIGIKKQKVGERDLSGEILTVGTVAYDPDLYVAQQEYLQSIKGRNLASDSNFGYSKQQTDEFTKTSKRKLLLMGMSENEIERLEASGKPEQSLYLPEGDKVWLYMTIYEYQAGLVKEGQLIEVEALAYPGETFTGKIVSVAPILEPMTRSLKVRALVDNTENKLKLQMYVNVRLKYDLGRKLAVPEEAIMHTGTRTIVFVAEPNGIFESRNVKLGTKAQGYYEVLDGLKANDEVVTSGNFLVDSESKLNAVLSQMGGTKDANQ